MSGEAGDDGEWSLAFAASHSVTDGQTDGRTDVRPFAILSARCHAVSPYSLYINNVRPADTAMTTRMICNRNNVVTGRSTY